MEMQVDLGKICPNKSPLGFIETICRFAKNKIFGGFAKEVQMTQKTKDNELCKKNNELFKARC